MKDVRTGLGFDVHRMVRDRPLILGGVTIPYSKGLLGHSDADVLLHAIGEALLGAAGLGDLGTHFPDTDPSLQGVSSSSLMEEILKLVREDGWNPVNADATLIAERPCLAPHIPAMRSRTASLLRLPEKAVNIKASTCEGLGFIGRGEGIAAMATVLIKKC